MWSQLDDAVVEYIDIREDGYLDEFTAECSECDWIEIGKQDRIMDWAYQHVDEFHSSKE